MSRTDREAKFETNHLMYADERVAHLVRLCARGFNRSLARRLALHGITFGQWVYLRILWKAEGLSQRELSEAANLTDPTTHTAINNLEKLGLVERRTLPNNRRKQCTFLTRKGRRLQNVLEPLAVKSNDIALKGITKKRQAELKNDLIRIIENLADDEAEAEALGLKVPALRAGMFE